MPKYIEYYFEVIRATKTRWYTNIIRNNHKILWTNSSERYKSKQSAMKPVTDLIKFIGKNKCEIIYTDKTKKEK